MPWTNYKGKADLKEGGLLPLGEKYHCNFCFHPGWSSLKFKWISGGSQTSVLALGYVPFPSVLKDCWNWTARGFLMLMWCTGSPKGWLRRQSAASGPASAADQSLQSQSRRSLPVAFLSVLPMSTSMLCGEAVMALSSLTSSRQAHVYIPSTLEENVWVLISTNRQYNLAQVYLIVVMAKHLHHCSFWVTMTR